MQPDPTLQLDLALSPVQIAPNTWWVGKRPAGQIFYANPYLRVFPELTGPERKPAFHFMIDPGSPQDFAVVRAKSEAVMGSLERVDAIHINHQDPDVGSAVGLMMGRFTPRAHVVCSEDTWRLIQYYNVPRERFVPLERFPHGMVVPNGDRLIPVPSPFCHFVGAVMLYDPQTKVLFTGDLFGALTEKDAKGLFADGSDWHGMRAFHQIYMPSNQALRYAIAQMRRLAPDVQTIAPQHGRVIRGEWVEYYIQKLEQLQVGLDIIEDRHVTEDTLRAWSTVLRRVLAIAEPVRPDVVTRLLEDADLRSHLVREGTGVRVVSMGRTAIERALRVLGDLLPSAYTDLVRFEAATAAGEMDLPTPNIELDESETPVPVASPTSNERPGRTTGGYAFVRLDSPE